MPDLVSGLPQHTSSILRGRSRISIITSQPPSSKSLLVTFCYRNGRMKACTNWPIAFQHVNRGKEACGFGTMLRFSILVGR